MVSQHNPQVDFLRTWIIFYLLKFHNARWAQEIAQSLKGVPYKNEDRVQFLATHVKMVLHVCDLSTSEAEIAGPLELGRQPV